MGSRILAGRYELIEKIGEGGMAVVFKSRDRLLNRYVAIKILRPEYTKDESFIDSFRRESQIAANLVHPNIVNVYDVGKEGNIYYIVMELVEGRALSDIIRDEAPLEPRRAATIAKQIASALSMAHKHQLIHRDVKPHNILMTADGVAKIADFGIAKAVTTDTFVEGGTEAVMGSVHYFSPEQARGAYVDEKSDIYSLGIVLYEMLTGKVPFDGDTAVAVAVKHMNEPMVPPTKLNPEIPSDLEEIVLKATSKLQMNRYKSADEMITALNFVKFSRFANPAAAASAAAEHGHLKDTLTEISDENYAREVEAAAAEGRELDTEAEIQKRKEKREEKENRGKKKKKAVRNADEEDGDEDERYDDYNEDDYFHPGRSIFLVLLTLAIMLAANFGLGLINNFQGTIKGKSHDLPKLVGMQYEQASEELAKIGVTLTVEVQIAAADKAAGIILSQTPAPGTVVKEGGNVRVTVSKGTEPIHIPDVEGMALTKAKRTLEGYHYTLGEVTEDYSEDVPKGMVISQDPVAGVEADQFTAVNLLVSLGPKDGEKNTVNLVGMTLEDAQYLLEDLPYELGTVSSVISASVPRGVIISTSPDPDEKLKDGDSIDIVVSMGPDGNAGPVQIIDPDAPVEPEIPETTEDPTAADPAGTETPAGTDPGTTADPGTGTGSGTSQDPAAEQPPVPAQLYSVAIYVDFNNASQDAFDFVVHVSDGINASSATNLGNRAKASGGELITVSGSGNNGKVVVMYGNEMAYEYSVDFEGQQYTCTYTGNNW